MALYAADGSLNITVVNGLTYVGRYAPDGSMNVVVSNGSTYTGLHHPSGAMYVINTEAPITSIQHPSGAWYVSDSPYFTGSNKVTVISGSLSPGGSIPGVPALTWNSLSSDATPDFLVDLPSGSVNPLADAAASDHLIVEYQLQSGGAWTQYVDRTLSAGDITDDVITVTGIGSLTNNDYFFRARLERGVQIGTNSSNTAVTINVMAAVPVNSVAPVISGNVQVTQLLTTTDGTWSNSPTGYTYQWKRDGSNIGSATANTYTLVELDAGAAITCEVTASNASGAGTPAASNSLTIDVYVVYLSQILDTADATTYSAGSWNSVNLGTAAANRKIVISFASRSTTITPSILSGTVGAASGTELVAREQTNEGGAWIWEYANTSDAAANISTTFAAAGQIRLGARLYAVYGAGTGTGYNNYNAATNSIANASVVVPTNGTAISGFFAINIGTPGTVTWTNATANGTESVIEGSVGTIDSAVSTTAGTYTVTAGASSSSQLYLVTVSFGAS